jgi:hypothetical protein
MKAALFSPMRYHGPSNGSGWPVASTTYSSEAAEKSMQSSIAQFRLADEVGFDWVTVAEHHYAPFSLNPNPMVTAGALTQVVRRAKIAHLGATNPIHKPVRACVSAPWRNHSDPQPGAGGGRIRHDRYHERRTRDRRHAARHAE